MYILFYAMNVLTPCIPFQLISFAVLFGACVSYPVEYDGYDGQIQAVAYQPAAYQQAAYHQPAPVAQHEPEPYDVR